MTIEPDKDGAAQLANAEDTRRWDFLRDAWRLAKPYWASEDKTWAWGLLAAVIALNLGSVFISVRINLWRNDFYNTLQDLDEHGFWIQIAIFTGLAAAAIVVGVYQTYLQQMLQIRWRRWLTRRYLGEWLDHKAYYRLQLEGNPADNPDQRISDDLNRFTDASLSLTLGLLNAVVTLFSFLTILWGLSGPLTIPLGSFGSFTLPGYMLWFALVYAIAGTWLTFKIGRPLVALNFRQQRYEADFRFALVRLRENTEAIALYNGEERELTEFRTLFVKVVDNFWAIMRRVKMLNWWTYFYNQFAIIFPYIVAAPRFFAKEMQLGGYMQTADAFGQVQSSLSFIVNSYNDIASWQSVVQRLAGFDARVRAVAAEALAPQPIAVERAGSGVTVAGLDLDLPQGAPLLHQVALSVEPGQAVLVTGPTGSGKSTLLRAMAGIWPYGKGAVRMALGRLLFLPQKPYLPLGSLRDAFSYPVASSVFSDAQIKEAIATVGLGAFAGRLDETDNWAQRLSLGEQQRLSFARVLLSQPDIVFLDEATSALDEPSEARFYQILRAALWHPTIVSVGHRGTLAAFHDRNLDIAPFRAAPSDS